MHTYLFIFGNHPALSALELKSLTELYGYSLEFAWVSAEIMEVKSLQTLKLDWWQFQLGGTVKIAEVKAVTKENNLSAVIKSLCQPKSDTKFNFGISAYKLPKLNTNNLGMEIKRSLTTKSAKIRFVVSKEKILSSVIVKKNNLLSTGAEFILIKNKNDEILVAQTKTVQDFVAFGERDYGRPAADGKNGMLPPKLAKIMINIAKCLPADILLDPFCGSGTVLQEALLAGYQQVHGSDLNEAMIKNSQRNINWLVTKSVNKKMNIKDVQIEKMDALELKKKYNNNSIGAIITEPYLGPVDRFNVVGKEKAIANELNESYEKFLNQAHAVLKKGKRLVMVVPIILGYQLPYKKWIKSEKFREVFPADLSVDQAKYSRSGQRIERLILVLEKK